MAYETLDDSRRLATTNTGIVEGTMMSEKSRLQSGIPPIEISNNLQFAIV